MIKILLIAFDDQYYPVYEDADYVILNHLRALSPDFQFILLCGVHDNAGAARVQKAYGKYCENIYTVPIPKCFQNTFRFLTARAFWLRFATLPFYAYYSDTFSKRVREVIHDARPHSVHFCDPLSVMYLSDVPERVPAILFYGDSLSRWFFEVAKTNGKSPWGLYYRIRYQCALLWEKNFLGRFRHVFVFSEEEKRWLLEKNPKARAETIRIGVDADYFAPAPEEEKSPSIVFTGILSYRTNIEAIKFFSKDILPLIRQEIPAARFVAVGRNPSPELSSLARDPLNALEANVPDTRKYMAEASVCVAPLRTATGGVKLKILFAMSMGKAVVATAKAIDGTPGIADSGGICIADDPGDFSRETVRLLKSRELREAMGRRAREFIKKHYSWENWKRSFSAKYASLIALGAVRGAY